MNGSGPQKRWSVCETRGGEDTWTSARGRGCEVKPQQSSHVCYKCLCLKFPQKLHEVTAEVTALELAAIYIFFS